MPEALDAAPANQPFVTMWKSDDDLETVTFGEFRGLVAGHADYLRAHGLQAGDTVILIMPQGIPVMAAFVAAMYLGAVPAILAYPNFKIDPAKYRFGLAGVSANLKARLVLIDEGFPQELSEHVTITEETRLVRAISETASHHPTELQANCEAGQIAFIQHSAGTTGLQKGVALSHSAVLQQVNHLAPALRIASGDRIYSWLPLYHDMGLIACFMLPMVCHLPLVMQSPTDWVLQPGTMLQLISRYRCTLAWIPNFTFQFLARRVRPQDRAELDLSSLRLLINCSEPVRASSMDEFRDTFSACKLQPYAPQSCYAMAETVFAVTQSGMDGHSTACRIWVEGETLRKHQIAKLVPEGTAGAVCLVSSGRCLPGSEVRIASADGKQLPPGYVGEIIINSDSLLDGYYNRPELTAKALRDGWYWSGDLGFVLDDEVYVIGRKKDLIIVAGENIYPQDVEEIVSSHPAVHEGRVVALGLYSPNLGTEDIVVVAEMKSEADLERAASIERELRNAIFTELRVTPRAIYLKPAKWIVKSTAGKPARSTTREKLFSEHPELRASYPGELTS
ncbi:MAG TPA: AMP-binding protein [Terriglobales bacterium]|nr:AMP-binding protein [Terriglobales bacterium]